MLSRTFLPSAFQVNTFSMVAGLASTTTVPRAVIPTHSEMTIEKTEKNENRAINLPPTHFPALVDFSSFGKTADVKSVGSLQRFSRSSLPKSPLGEHP